MKNSGGEPKGNADDVLDLVARHVKVGRDLAEAIAGAETIHEIFHPGSAVHNQGLSERLGRDRPSHPRACRPAAAAAAPTRRRRR